MPGITFTNNFPAVQAQIKNELEIRTIMAADGLKNQLRSDLDGGALPIQSDTKALAGSLGVQTPTSSDYAMAAGIARSRYLSAASKYMIPVRRKLTPAAYTPPHFDERLAPPEPLAQIPNSVIAAVFTPLGYGIWWEFGHNNQFTMRYEHRPWMLPTALVWAPNMANYYLSLV